MIQRKQGKTKTSFLKETVENADLHKAVLNKTMTTHQQCEKYDFVAPLTKFRMHPISKVLISNLFSFKKMWAQIPKFRHFEQKVSTF